MDGSTIFLIIIAAVLLLLMVLYNRLVALRQTRKNAFSDIDVQLKQRFNLVPQLVETVKGYAKHEKNVFENVTEARAGVQKAEGTEGRAQAEGMLGQAMLNLFAVAENYPDLKANQNFIDLQKQLRDIEDKIAAARRFFNNATSEYNTATQQFPAVLVARTLGFGQEAFFELGEEEAQTVQHAPEVAF